MIEPPEPLTRQRRRWHLVGAVALVVLVVGYSGFWVYSADRVTSYLESWARSPGGTVSWQSLSTAGFPFRLSITLEKPVALDAQGNQWSTDWVFAHMRPWDWATVTINTPDPQEVIVNDSGGDRTFTIHSNDLTGVFSTLSRRTYTATITGTKAQLRDDNNRTLIANDIHLDAEVTPHGSADLNHRSAHLWFSVNDVRSAELSALLLGERIKEVSGEIELFGPLPLPVNMAHVARWRDAGGIAEVRSLRLEYGPMALHTEGTLALDRDLQPVGAFTARVQGFKETVDAFHHGGIVTGGEALTTKLVLGALAETDSMTGKSTLKLPVSIQDRELYAGPLKLMKIPPVHWTE
jgi:hypothetical protein